MTNVFRLRRILMTVFLIVMPAASGIAAESQPLVDIPWLSVRLKDPTIVIVDLRSEIDGGGQKAYEAGHIPGSIHSDYIRAGWRQTRNGIPGLLPDAATLERVFGELGLEHESHVVLVPAGVHATDFSTAARAYWTLKAAGHVRVSILDGGHAAWAASGQPVSTGPSPVPAHSIYDVRLNEALIAEAGQIESNLLSGKSTLIDSRPPEFFAGEDKVAQASRAGRIPGAVQRDTHDIYNETTNRLKSLNELKTFFAAVPAGPVIAYCNTGQWSATNWFVLSELLGRKETRLFPGSMVEWTARPGRPVETGKAKTGG